MYHIQNLFGSHFYYYYICYNYLFFYFLVWVKLKFSFDKRNNSILQILWNGLTLVDLDGALFLGFLFRPLHFNATSIETWEREYETLIQFRRLQNLFPTSRSSAAIDSTFWLIIPPFRWAISCINIIRNF